MFRARAAIKLLDGKTIVSRKNRTLVHTCLGKNIYSSYADPPKILNTTTNARNKKDIIAQLWGNHMRGVDYSVFHLISTPSPLSCSAPS